MNTTHQRHPNADVLIAIAEGRPIQFRWVTRNDTDLWTDWSDTILNITPSVVDTAFEWRIKPEPKPLTERWYFVMRTDEGTRLNAVFHRSSLDEAVAVYNAPFREDGRRNFIGLMCMHTDETTVRKVEFFSKAELKAKGVL